MYKYILFTSDIHLFVNVFHNDTKHFEIQFDLFLYISLGFQMNHIINHII